MKKGNKDKKQQMNRRQLLNWFAKSGLTAAAATPFEMLLNSMVNGVINKAYAQATGITPRNFVFIQLPGGPPRWTYDLFLNPRPNLNQRAFVPSAGVATGYVANNGVYDQASYITTNVKGIQAPLMWSHNIPTSAGPRPMADLLDNILALQGIHEFSDSHPIALVSSVSPLGTLQSLTALSADYSSAPIKAVASRYGGNFEFKSKFQNSFTSVNGGNLVRVLLTPFSLGTVATHQSNKAALAASLNRASASLATFAASEHPGASILANDRGAAIELMTRSFGNLDTVWNDSVTRYSNLCRDAQDHGTGGVASLAGVTDMPIGTSGTRDTKYQYNGTIINTPDLRTNINRSHYDVAQYFALTEFIIKNRLSSSVSFTAGGMSSVIGGYNTDEHTVGAMLSTLMNIMNWRVFSACLLELINQLKTANLFNDTVIALSGEFARSPRVDGSGSDHGGKASHMVFYSGAIQGPLILGRMQANYTGMGNNYLGSWGVGDLSRDYGHVLSTAATLLRVPNPLTARSSMVTDTGGVITAASGIELSHLY